LKSIRGHSDVSARGGSGGVRRSHDEKGRKDGTAMDVTWKWAREKKVSGGAPLSAGCSPGSRTFFQTQPAKMTELSVSKQRGKVAQHIPAWRGRRGARFVSVKSEESEPCNPALVTCAKAAFSPGTSSRRTSCSRWAEAIYSDPAPPQPRNPGRPAGAGRVSIHPCPPGSGSGSGRPPSVKGYPPIRGVPARTSASRRLGNGLISGFGGTPQILTKARVCIHKTTSHARSQCPEICSFGPHRSFLPAMPMKCFALLTRSGE